MTAATRKASEWKTGDRLSWSGEEWTFWQFDPDYPRAICQSDALRVCAIDIASAKRLNPATGRKRNERARRKADGQVEYKGWLSASDHAALTQMARDSGMTQAQVVSRLIGMVGAVRGLERWACASDAHFGDHTGVYAALDADGEWVRHSDLTAAVGLGE